MAFELISQNIAEDGFNDPLDPSLLATFGEIDFIPPVGPEKRHEYALRKIWPLRELLSE